MSVFVRDNYRILYIHVPKTGGTAIELFFEKNGFLTSFVDRGGKDSLLHVLKCSPQHLNAEQIKSIFNLGRFDYCFMTVRNPIKRLISEYKMRAVMQPSIEEVDIWIEKTLQKCKSNPYLLDNHIRPQSDFCLDNCEIFKQEDGFGDDWIKHIEKKIGINFVHSSMDVAMRFDSVSKVTLNSTSLALVRQFYSQDFERFGYSTFN